MAKARQVLLLVVLAGQPRHQHLDVRQRGSRFARRQRRDGLCRRLAVPGPGCRQPHGAVAVDDAGRGLCTGLLRRRRHRRRAGEAEGHQVVEADRAPAPSTAPTTAPTTTQPTSAAASGIVPHTSGPGITTTTNPKDSAGAAPPSAPACSSTTTSSTAVRAGTQHKARAPSTAPTTAPTTQWTWWWRWRWLLTTAAASGIEPHSSGPATTTTTTTTTTAPPSAPACSSTTTSTTAVGAGFRQRARTSPTTLAEADASAHGQSGGEPVLPIIVVAVLILLLGGVSWFRWRRRPAEE